MVSNAMVLWRAKKSIVNGCVDVPKYCIAICYENFKYCQNGMFTFCIVCQPNVVLSQEEFQTEFSKPGKEVGVSLAQPDVAISKPEKSDNLKK